MEMAAWRVCLACLLETGIGPGSSRRGHCHLRRTTRLEGKLQPGFVLGTTISHISLQSQQKAPNERQLFVSLYRELLKESRLFPVAKVSRKLESSLREVFRMYMHTTTAEQQLDPGIEALEEEGKAAIRLLHYLRMLPSDQFDLIFQYSGAGYRKLEDKEEEEEEGYASAGGIGSVGVKEVEVRSVGSYPQHVVGERGSRDEEGVESVYVGREVLRPGGFEKWLLRLGVGYSESIGLAISGGVDSMALALVARDWSQAVRERGDGGGRAVGLVVDHKLREESGREACTVSRWLTALGMENVVLECHWPEGKPQSGRLQQIARTQRYSLLEAACRERGIRFLLTAHHADDQAELFLLRLSRCSGVAGLAGMSPISLLPTTSEASFPCAPPAAAHMGPIRLLRPFLGVPKWDLYKACEERGHPWVEDPTNRSLAYARNRIRAVLEEPTSEFPTEVVWRVMGACRRMRARTDAARDALLRDAVTMMEDGAVIDIEVLAERLHVPQQEPIILRVLSAVVQAVSQKELPPRTRGLRALVTRLRTPPFEGEMHVGGHVVVAALKGSGGLKASVARYKGWPPPRS